MSTRRTACLVDRLEPRVLLAVFPGVGAQPTGPLTGRIVYTSGGHGYTADDVSDWDTQRGETNEMVEDFGNQDQLLPFAEHLWRAGATVVPMRPVGFQRNEVIVDNLQATYTGTWSNGSSTPYFSTSNGSGVGYRAATGSLTETAVARFTPNIPATGFYPVYAWALDGANRAPDQLYRVVHADGATEVKVDHTRVGKGWVYLGTYYFRAGTSGRVEVSNRTASGSSRSVIADAIRFGNGMGDLAPDGNASGQSREDEASLYWVESSAGWTAPGVRVDSSNWRTLATDVDANVSAPLRWAAYMNAAPFGQSVYLGWHSNASGTTPATARGTVGLYNTSTTTDTANQLAWARLVAGEINNDLVTLGAPPLEYAWQNRTDLDYAASFSYGEIRGDTSGNEFDATIIEVAFHDNTEDAALLRDPKVRDRLGQSASQAIIRYFNQFGAGPTPAFAPDAPTNVRTSLNANGDVVLNWDVPSYNAGDAPTGFRIYGSRDGYSFATFQAVAGGATRTATIPKAVVGTGVAYFKLAAVNAGGESAGSNVVAARVGETRFGRVLIVDGFDRFDRTLNPRQTTQIFSTKAGEAYTNPVTIDRVRARFSNSFDYAVQHATALATHSARFGIDTVDNQAIVNGQVSLNGYRAVIWMLGEESTKDLTFASQEQTALTNYFNAGGRVFMSGSEIGYDLTQRSQTSFLNNTLKTTYVGDNSNTYVATGAAGTIFADVPAITFDDGTNTYDVNSADRLGAGTNAGVIMNYTGGLGGAAAIAWNQPNGSRAVVMGFPFETIVSPSHRSMVMRRVLDYFQIGTTVSSPAPVPAPSPSPEVVPLASLLASGPARPGVGASVLRDDADTSLRVVDLGSGRLS
jgi:hypothetical protein